MRRLLALLPLLTLAACAGNMGWANPALPKAQWSADYDSCHAYANDQAGPTDYSPPDDRSSNPMRQMDRFDSGRRFDAYLSLCMESLGYHRSR